jgi:hypothetical protein
LDDWVKNKPEDKQKREERFVKGLLIWINYALRDLGNPKRQTELLERAFAIEIKPVKPRNVNLLLH